MARQCAGGDAQECRRHLRAVLEHDGDAIVVANPLAFSAATV